MNLRYHQEYSAMLWYLTLQLTLISHLETNVVSSTNKRIKTLANHDLPKHLRSQHLDVFCQVAGWTSLDLRAPLRNKIRFYKAGAHIFYENSGNFT